jgi:hypothetical protein
MYFCNVISCVLINMDCGFGLQLAVSKATNAGGSVLNVQLGGTEKEGRKWANIRPEGKRRRARRRRREEEMPREPAYALAG